MHSHCSNGYSYMGNHYTVRSDGRVNETWAWSQLGLPLALALPLDSALGRLGCASRRIANLPVHPGRDHLGQIGRHRFELIVHLVIHPL